MSDQVFYIFSAILLGLVIGALIMYFATGSNKDSEQTISKLKKELENYQKDVAEHFEETADLVDGMTQSYKKVFDHLGKSARKLMTEEQIQEQLEQRKGNKVTLEYLTEEGEDQHDHSESASESEELVNEILEETVDESVEELAAVKSGELDDTVLDSEELLAKNDYSDEDNENLSEADNKVDDLHIVENSNQKDSEDETDLEKEVELREKNIYS